MATTREYDWKTGKNSYKGAIDYRLSGTSRILRWYGEISKALWNARDELDRKKLRGLALNSKDVVRRRLGYLFELLKLPSLIKEEFAGWRWLDPSHIKDLKGKVSQMGAAHQFD